MIAGIKRGKQPLWMRRIPHYPIKIDHRIEVPGSPDPGIHSFAICFAEGIGMVIAGAHIRRDGAPDRMKAMSMRPENDLLVGRDDMAHQIGMLGSTGLRFSRECSQIVHTF